MLSPTRQNAEAGIADDIECVDWLEEIDFPQYEETFCTNCSLNGSLLSRKRLAQIRLKDFPKMNITNFEHQKILMAHIQHTLQYAFHSPLRKREVRLKMGKSLEDVNKTLFTGEEPKGGTKTKSQTVNASINPRRRRSFDTQAWNCINKLRTQDPSCTLKADQLKAIRAGVAEVIINYLLLICL